eukprot:Nk52_evm50s745 gene=Nk52_evmTU50s745
MSAFRLNCKKVCVLGGGSFGTALAAMTGKGHPNASIVMLLRNEQDRDAINSNHRNPRYMTDYELTLNVTATCDPVEALKDSDYIIHAVPAQSSRAFLKNISHLIGDNTPIICTSKGIELNTLELMSNVIPEALGRPNHPVAFFSGPSFAKLIMEGDLTCVVVASKEKSLAEQVQHVLATPTVRTYCTTDVVGVELGGSLKNVIAIAAGMAEGLGYGANSMAAVVTRGCSELRRLGVALGAQPVTIAGLSGIGDLMLTCYGAMSRNRTVGFRLGKGETLEEISTSMKQVAEGVPTTHGACTLAERHNVDVPIMFAVKEVLDGKKTPKEACDALMNLPLREED